MTTVKQFYLPNKFPEKMKIDELLRKKPQLLSRANSSEYVRESRAFGFFFNGHSAATVVRLKYLLPAPFVSSLQPFFASSRQFTLNTPTSLWGSLNYTGAYKKKIFGDRIST